MLLAALLACTGDTGTGTTDTSSPVDGDSGSSDSGATTEAPPPVASIWPPAPYPDSPLSVTTDAGRPDTCTWTVDGVVDEIDACGFMAEEFGLLGGETLHVVGHFDGGPDSEPDEVTVLDLPTLLVTESMGGSLAVLDVSTKQRTHTVAFEGDFPMPIAAVVQGDTALVSLHVEQGLAQVDTASWTVTGTLDLATPVYWIDQPADGSEVLVTDQGEDRLLRVVGTDVTPIDLPAPPVSVRVQGTRAWVAGRTGGSPEQPEDSGFVAEGFVSRLDLATGELTSVDQGSEPYWAEPSPSGAQVAVADQGLDQLVLLGAEDLAVQATYDLPGGPTGLAWSPDGELIYVALYGEGLVLALDAASGAEQQRWELGVGAVGIFPRSDGRWLYVPVLHENGLAFIDTMSVSDDPPLIVPGFSGPRGVTILD